MSGTTEKQKRPSTQAKRKKKDVKPSSFKGERKKKGAMRWGEEPWDGKQQQNSGIISSRPGLTLGEINKFPLLEPLSNTNILILDSYS
jgi:hypothetical protein